MQFSDFHRIPTPRPVVGLLLGAGTGAILVTALQYAARGALEGWVGVGAIVGAVVGLVVTLHQRRPAAADPSQPKATPAAPSLSRAGKLASLGLAVAVLGLAAAGWARTVRTQEPHSLGVIGFIAVVGATLTGLSCAFIARRVPRR